MKYLWPSLGLLLVMAGGVKLLWDQPAKTNGALYPWRINTLWGDDSEGYVDENGRTRIPPQYNVTEPFSEDLAFVKLLGEEKWSLPSPHFVIGI